MISPTPKYSYSDYFPPFSPAPLDKLIVSGSDAVANEEKRWCLWMAVLTCSVVVRSWSVSGWKEVTDVGSVGGGVCSMELIS